MASYDDKFNMALSYLKRPDITNPTGDKPICYVIYDVRDAIDMKRTIKETLIPKAKYFGFDVKLFSIGQRILEYLHNYPDKDELLDELQQDNTKMSTMWNQVFLKRENNTKTDYIASIVSNGIVAFDAIILIRKLMKGYGFLFGNKKKKQKKSFL